MSLRTTVPTARTAFTPLCSPRDDVSLQGAEHLNLLAVCLYVIESPAASKLE